MVENKPLLKIRFDGKAVGPGKIPVSHLQIFLTNFNKALQRADRQSPGPLPRSIKRKLELNLVSLDPGSSAAVLGFVQSRTDPVFTNMDDELNICKDLVCGLKTIQSDNADIELPPGYNSGVLKAWRDLGKLFRQGINRIEFTLNHPAEKTQTSFTPSGFEQMQKLITGSQVNL